jgi:MFS family permease
MKSPVRGLWGWFLVGTHVCAFVPQSRITTYPISVAKGKALVQLSFAAEQIPKGPRTRLQVTKDDDTPEPSIAWFWKCCLPLWFIYISNQWSRSSLYYLVDFSADAKAFSAMNVDIGFSQVQYGLLASLAFTALFAVASLGAGIAADRFNRKQLTIVSAVVWSVATIGTSLADSFELVVGCRVLMGLACAFSTPTAYTLLRDRVTRDRQATASSIYGTGVALASGLSSLTLLLDESVGWRSSLEIVGGFGILATALTVFLLDDDAERDQEKQYILEEESTSPNNDSDDQFSQIGSDIASVLASERARWIFLGSFLRFSSGLCIGVWAAPFFRMEFSDFQTEYAVAQAFISAGIASMSGILGGATADWLSSRTSDRGVQDNGGIRMWVPVIGSILAAPAWFLAVQPDIPFESAMAWLAVEYLVSPWQQFSVYRFSLLEGTNRNSMD